MWNLQQIIFVWRQRYWQIFKSALVYLWLVQLTGFYDDRTELNLIKISLLDLLPKNKNEEIIKINKLKQYWISWILKIEISDTGKEIWVTEKKRGFIFFYDISFMNLDFFGICHQS